MINKNGFTLIEMLVAIMIFSIVIGAISEIFVSGILEQRRALASRALLDQASFCLEYMSRALRMAKKETVEHCLSEYGLNYEITDIEPGFLGLKFINHLEGNDCQAFFLQNGQLKYKKKIGTLEEETLNLTSEELEIISLFFNLSGQSQEDNLQPRVTIFLDIRGKDALPEQKPEIKIQTTISQRNLDVKYGE
ncbi:MAG: type II secretion system protein [Patescibacteria group bacterium]|nr:type II secretion system protein [Patescibacteria group bacterium]